MNGAYFRLGSVDENLITVTVEYHFHRVSLLEGKGGAKSAIECNEWVL
jgi:hypothetical protein